MPIKDFLLVLLLTSASTPTFLFLSVLLPEFQLFFIALWSIAFALDICSTYGFYRKNPAQFKYIERNRIFALFTEHLGFKRGFVAFLLTFEVPVIMLFALIFLQIICAYMFSSTFNPSACIATGFGVAGLGHLQAALKNFAIARREERHG